MKKDKLDLRRNSFSEEPKDDQPDKCFCGHVFTDADLIENKKLKIVQGSGFYYHKCSLKEAPKDHVHCWEKKKPPCGQRIEHLKCCICEKPNPKQEEVKECKCNCHKMYEQMNCPDCKHYINRSSAKSWSERFDEKFGVSNDGFLYFSNIKRDIIKDFISTELASQRKKMENEKRDFYQMWYKYPTKEIAAKERERAKYEGRQETIKEVWEKLSEKRGLNTAYSISWSDIESTLKGVLEK